MSFRNDHDAALARIEALERELAEARAEARTRADNDMQTIAVLERELFDLRRHRPDPPPRKIAPLAKSAPVDELPPLAPAHGPPVSRAAIVVAAACGIAIGVIAFLAATT